VSLSLQSVSIAPQLLSRTWKEKHFHASRGQPLQLGDAHDSSINPLDNLVPECRKIGVDNAPEQHTNGKNVVRVCFIHLSQPYMQSPLIILGLTMLRLGLGLGYNYNTLHDLKIV
jgi:hypothetical protein